MLKKTLLLLAVATCAAATHASAQMLTISEVYGGGGNSGSTYTNDFIELYNYGSTPITMTGLSVYYASTTGTFTNTTGFSTALSGTLAAGSYYLIQEAAGGAGTTALSNVNVTGSINLSATGGKVALGLTTTTPSSTAGAVTATNNPTVIDFVGYGAAANQYIGTGPAPAPTTNTTSLSKGSTPGASVSNSTDYTVGTPSPTGTGAVPEPSTYTFVAFGALGVLAMASYRHRRA